MQTMLCEAIIRLRRAVCEKKENLPKDICQAVKFIICGGDKTGRNLRVDSKIKHNATATHLYGYASLSISIKSKRCCELW